MKLHQLNEIEMSSLQEKKEFSVKHFLEYYEKCVYEESISDSIIARVRAGDHEQDRDYVRILRDRGQYDFIDFTNEDEEIISQFITRILNRNANRPSAFWYGFPILYTIEQNNPIIKPIFYHQINYNNENRPEIPDIIDIRVNYDAFSDLGISKEVLENFTREIGLNNEQNNLTLTSLTQIMRERFPDLRYVENGQGGNNNENNTIFLVGAIFTSEPSPYTRGLINELRVLRQQVDALPEDYNYSQSCLKFYINPEINRDNHQIQNNNICRFLEVFELNESQRRAIEQSFRNPITIVTGPPGTGKSQIVASLILNALFSNQKVLFASKNHKAVKVIEEKICRLINYPVLIRLGRGDGDSNNLNNLRIRLINYLNSLINVQRANINVNHNNLENLRNNLNNLMNERERIQNRIEEYRRIRNRILAYFRENEERYKNDRQYQLLIEKLKDTDNLRRKNLLNKKIKNVALYLKNMNAVHRAESFEQLLEEYDNLNQQIKERSVEYVRAWFTSFPERLNDEKRRNIREYIEVLQALENNGVRGDEYKNLLRRREVIQRNITEFLHAWCVTNLSVRGELPLIEGFFDLLIIDEASQCDIASVIPLLYRAKRVVVLGDPNQLRHITHVSNRMSISLLNNYNIPLYYNYVTNSFFDLSSAIVQGQDSTVFLNEHFRSHSDIISFSNQQWYDNRLLISTDYRYLNPRPTHLTRCIEWINVQGALIRGASGSVYISEEVEKVVETAINILNDNNFNGDIGIISPFRLQVNKIQERLYQRLGGIIPPRILIDSTVKFQGDEKDIIIFSPVISEAMPNRVRYYLETSYLLNVAITRARSKLIVVGNKNACLHCGIEPYENFVHYVDAILNGNIQNIEEHIESPYEYMLYEAMRRENIPAIPQYVLGQYRLDFAIINENTRIDVEVDGVQYHTDWTGERLKYDIVRNQRLQNLGWKVLRLWSYEIRDNIDYCIRRIRNMMNHDVHV